MRASWLCAAFPAAASAPVIADDTPKYGGTLTLRVPADSPQSLDAQREQGYATAHSAAPFYSTLVRFNPLNPPSTTSIH
jgi:ABC-type oligopeptide transport system substrate-binding subunit